MSVEQEAVKRAVAYLNSRLQERLEELGPGWAIGYRLKQKPYSPKLQSYEPASVDLEWETHEVELIDGQVPLVMQGFQYVGLKS